MNRILRLWLIAVLVAASVPTFATNRFTYYIYTLSDYQQGPWSRADLLKQPDQTYLAPQAREGLFGSELTDLANAIVEELSINAPERYNWSKELRIQGDTVVIEANDADAMARAAEELVASLTLNGFGAVTFSSNEESATWTIDDLTLPYFDLVSSKVSANAEEVTTEIEPTPATTQAAEIEHSDTAHSSCHAKNCASRWHIALIISLLINVILVIVLIRNRR